LEFVVTLAAFEGVFAAAAVQFVAVVIGLHDVIERIARPLAGARAEVEVFDFIVHDVVDGGDDFVSVALAGDFANQDTEATDMISIIPKATTHGVIAAATIQFVVFAASMNLIVTCCTVKQTATFVKFGQNNIHI